MHFTAAQNERLRAIAYDRKPLFDPATDTALEQLGAVFRMTGERVFLSAAARQHMRFLPGLDDCRVSAVSGQRGFVAKRMARPAIATLPAVTGAL